MGPAPGASFDRYRIDGVLGEGGMGRVYRAYDERLQRWVALKVLIPPTAGGSTPDGHATDGAARLLREARAAAALDHPNAVAIFDVGEARADASSPPLPFIAMELIDGRSLRAFVGVEAVGLTERVRWLIDVARALAAAHERGLVHRDVKPENVMVRGDGVVKVLDFGIARRASSGKVDPTAATLAPAAKLDTLTAGGHIVGTPFYMAPEQMRGDPIDTRVDQFSWGVVAYELLSGKLPWDREGDSLKVVSEVLTRDAPPLRTIVPDVPASVEAIVARALMKAPQDRHASMAAIVATLEASVLGSARSLPPSIAEALGNASTVQSTRTSLASAGLRPSAPSRRAPRVRASIGAAALVVLATSVTLGIRWRAEPRQRPDATSAPAPTAITDLPVPRTTPDALAAYEDAMSARREGDTARFMHQAERAVTLDPKLAPALMRLGISLFAYNPEQAREYYSRAVALRDTLTPRDQEFLAAFEPFVQRDTSDLAETRARLAALAKRYPMDAEIAFVLARQDDKAADFDGALAGYRRAMQLDPRFVFALISKIYLLAIEKGAPDGALADSAECEKLAPGNPDCALVRDRIYTQRGQCAELEKDARRLIAQRPSSYYGYLTAAQALSTMGSPLASVRDLIVQTRARMGDDDKEWIPVALLDAHAAELDGDFATADTLLRERETRIASATLEPVHGTNAWERAQVALETGRPAEARAVAAEFRARRDAWVASPTGSSLDLELDRTVPLLALLADGAGQGRRELEVERNRWLDRWARTPGLPPYVWLTAYAEAATSADDARAALGALTAYEPFPPLWDFSTEFWIGRTYFLAGRLAEAIPQLRTATRACDAIDRPFDYVRASFYLGQALERTGDAAGACAAYDAVLARWGAAKPRSVTAEGARRRRAALRCPRTR